jgi:hypothetical protein
MTAGSSSLAGTSSQNSVLFYSLYYKVCELQLSYEDANAAVLLHLVQILQMKAYLFVQTEPVIFSELFPIQYHFHPASHQLAYILHILCLEQNLLLKTLSCN